MGIHRGTGVAEGTALIVAAQMRGDERDKGLRKPPTVCGSPSRRRNRKHGAAANRHGLALQGPDRAGQAGRSRGKFPPPAASSPGPRRVASAAASNSPAPRSSRSSPGLSLLAPLGRFTLSLIRRTALEAIPPAAGKTRVRPARKLNAATPRFVGSPTPKKFP